MRWVHVAEVPDIATLLRGGELVLSTGIGLPADDAALRRFIGELADVGAAGLMIELGRRYTGSVPRAMVDAAARRGLPLVELRRATPFVPITEAVHALVIDAQLTELRATEEIHQRFTELSVEGAEPAEVLRAGGGAGRLPGGAGEPGPPGARLRRGGGEPAGPARRLGAVFAPGPIERPYRLRRRRRLAGDHGRRPRPGLGAAPAALARRRIRQRQRAATDAAGDPGGAGRVGAGAGPADPP